MAAWRWGLALWTVAVVAAVLWRQGQGVLDLVIVWLTGLAILGLVRAAFPP